ncbi:MAG: C-terminal binding protein [Dehalococcoidia bacterium]
MPINVAQVFDTAGIPDYGAMFKQARADITLTKRMCRTENEIIEAARNADAVICAATLQPMSRRVLEALPRCRFVQSLGIGYEGVDIAAATELGIMVANVPDYCIEEVSDHTMALILNCTRKITDLNAAVKSGKWDRQPCPYFQQNIWPRMARLRGMTLGLVGFGRIPQAVVPKARAFGLRIIACDPYAPQTAFDAAQVESFDLDRLLKESDFVSLHAPLTEKTHGLIGREQLRKFKPTAYLINTARGPLVDTKALYDCLKDGVLAGAALDVVEPEPIDIDNPLVKLDNVVITAHSGAASPAAMMEMFNRPGQEMVNVLVKGEWPRGLVNPQVKDVYREKWVNPKIGGQGID